MKTKDYGEAVSSLKISDLRAFLDAQKATPKDWPQLVPAPRKRERFMQMLKDDESLRAEFVAFYQANHDGEAPNFALWEEVGQPVVSVPEDAAEQASHAHPSAQAADPLFSLPEGNDEGDDAGEVVLDSLPTDLMAVPPGVSLPASASSVIVDGYFDQVSSDVAGLSPTEALSALNVIEEGKEETYFRMGAIISHMKKTEAHAALGYENLRALIADQTHLEYRMAMYLATNYEKVVELGIPSEKLTGIGWTKLRDVLPYMTPENYAGWLDKARTLQKAALYAAIAEEKKTLISAPTGATPDASTPKVAVETKTKGFAVTEDQSSVVDQAIAKAKIEANTDANGPALAAMAAAYLGQPAVKQAGEPDTSDEALKALGAALKAKEKKYGEGFVRLLEAVQEFWPTVEVDVSFPD